MVMAEMIRKARKEKHITQQQLADATGLSVMSIRRYEARNEKARRTPPIDECKKIADALGVPWSELMGFTDLGNGVYAHEMKQEEATRWRDRLGVDDTDESVLLEAFRLLNVEGKRECIKRVIEMTELSYYRDMDS